MRRFPVSVDLCPVDLYTPRSPGTRLPLTRAGPPSGGPVRSTPERTFEGPGVSVPQVHVFYLDISDRGPQYHWQWPTASPWTRTHTASGGPPGSLAAQAASESGAWARLLVRVQTFTSSVYASELPKLNRIVNAQDYENRCL